MTKDKKIKDLEDRIKKLEERPVYVPYPFPVQSIPEQVYLRSPCCPPQIFYGTGTMTTTGGQ